MKHKFVVAALAAALTLSACKDSGAPAMLELTEAQATDMMEALSAVGSSTGFFHRTAEYRQGPNVQLATITLDQTDPCPNGGTHRMQGTLNMNDAGTQMTANITQGYTGCKSTSPNRVLWTFDGAPNIVFQFTMTMSATSGDYSFTGTQEGAIKAASSLGSGQCAINLAYTGSGNAQTGSGSATVSGTVCGRTINFTMTE